MVFRWYTFFGGEEDGRFIQGHGHIFYSIRQRDPTEHCVRPIDNKIKILICHLHINRGQCINII